MTTIKRRIKVEGNLYFEYEVSPHRAILARRSEVEANDFSSETISCLSLGKVAVFQQFYKAEGGSREIRDDAFLKLAAQTGPDVR